MDPFVGEIRIVPFSFAPVGWALCNGQILSITQNTALFSLLGTYYGGNGTSNFALPNLQAAVPMDYGQGNGLMERELGELGGSASSTLNMSQLGPHTHPLVGSTSVATATAPSSSVVYGTPPGAARQKSLLYKPGEVSGGVVLDQSVVGQAGGNQPHNNLQPFLVLTFIIALQGVYPPRS